jgi:hypothetical protein
MKTKLLLIFLGLTAVVYSQITLTHSDYDNALDPGSAYTSYATPYNGPTLSVFVGEPSSSAQTWDFSDYDFSQVGNGVSIDPSSAPLYSSFPGCNIVMADQAYNWGYSEDTLHSWTYQELTSDQLLLHGLSDETEAWPIYDPPVVQAVMPFTYGTTWETDPDTTYLFPPDIYSVSKSVYLVDAFGTMTLPSGNYACLRLTGFHQSISYPVLDTLYTKNYHWYSNDLTEVHITSIYEEQFDLTTIEIGAFSYVKAGGPAGMSDNNLSGTNLSQNSPNPFCMNTSISYSLSEPQNVILTVMDITGKVVKNLISERQETGNYQVDFSATGLNPGTYFYQLKTESYCQVRKMTIVR